MKTAFLADICIRTRIVADVEDPDNLTWEELERITQKAIDKVKNRPTDFIISDNVGDIVQDTECPYPFNKEEEKEHSLDVWFSQTDFSTMEKMFSLKHTDFPEEDGYQTFVDECHKRWDKLSLYRKQTFKNLF